MMRLARRDFFKASAAAGGIAIIGTPTLAAAPAAGHVAYCSETGLSWWDPNGASTPCRLRSTPVQTGEAQTSWTQPFG